MRRKLFAVAVGLALITIPSIAKDTVQTKQVQFDKGTNGTTVEGHIKGGDSVLYKLGAKEGQTMSVSMKSKNAHFNIYGPGKGPGEEAIFVGEPGVPFVGELPENGTYTISVYVMRAIARKEKNTSYTLNMSIK